MTIKHHPSVELIQQEGGDVMVAAAAKVSVSGDAAHRLGNAGQDSVEGLIRYLMKHRHGSPFEHGMMTFYVHAPVFVTREMLRHRHASINEESGRYRQLEPVFWSPDKDRPIAKVEGYKSARPMFERGTRDQHDLIRENDKLYDTLHDAYELELSMGIAPEVARRLLPVGVYSSMWITFNPRSLMHFLSLRTHHPDAMFVSYPQEEIQTVALQMEVYFAEHWPITHEAFVSLGRVSP